MTRTSRSRATYLDRLKTEHCQVRPWLVHVEGNLEWIAEAAEIKRWMSNIKIDRSEVHHLYGRNKHKDENDWFCNLILVDKSCHDWGHANGPKFELACYRAKLEMRRQYVKRFGIPPEIGTDESELHWHPVAMGRVLMPFDGLCGRIHYLAGKTDDPLYLDYARELLEVLGE